MSTQDLEKAVRDAAGNLLTAINAAKAAGLDVRWPAFPGGLAVIAISETSKVKAPAATAQSVASAAVAKPTLVAATAVPATPVTATPAAASAASNRGDAS